MFIVPQALIIREDKTYGALTASACHATALPTDCNPLSVNGEFWFRLNNGQDDLQNPAKTASFPKSFDMAPNSQYTNVCHMASRNPQKIYNHPCAGYVELVKSICAGRSVRV